MASETVQVQNDEALARNTMRRVEWRLLPLVTLLFLACQIDRGTIGYAALTMNASLGLTPYLFGWAAGVFFLGYILLEVPSNVMLNRIGAKVWITRILASWGLVCAATAFVQGPRSLMAMRFLLGAAEAGFLPGMILYLTWWFPQERRARVVSLFGLANPLAGLLGGPLAALVLPLDGTWGLHGWQWLFLLEGLPSVLLAGLSLRFLTDRPTKATWLSPAQRTWLEATVRREQVAAPSHGPHGLRAGLMHPAVLFLGVAYIGLIMGLYGVAVWLPTLLKGLGSLADTQVALLSAVPFAVAGAGSYMWARVSDRSGERLGHVAAALLVGAAGFAASAVVSTPLVATALLTLAAVGVYSALPIFWAVPGTLLSGTAAAVGIALVNSMGNFGGFMSPFLVGWIRDSTGSFTDALLMLAAGTAVSGLMFLAARSRLAVTTLAEAR